MNIKFVLCMIVLVVFSTTAMAAKPSVFKKSENVTLADGSSVKTKKVICSNKKEFALIRIDKKWCSDIDASYCSKNHIKTAKKLCK